MRYEAVDPIPPLTGIAETIWLLSGHADDLEGRDQPVLPDGRPELILHLADSFARVDEHGHASRQASILLAGQLIKPLTLRPTGRIAVVGIRFAPYGAAALGIGSVRELSGLTLGAGDVSASLARALEHVRSATDDPATAAMLAQQALLRCVNQARIAPEVRHVVRAISARRGVVSIDALAADVSWTRRHLERRFQDTVGIGPKRLARIARFQHALHRLEHSGPARRGSRTAADCGYADQAHFIRDFREFAGATPGEHLLRRAELTDFFRERSQNS